MNSTDNQLRQTQKFWLILLPMVGTVAGIRLYLHVVGIHHFFLGPYLIHHLYSGALLVIFASFLVSFTPSSSKANYVAFPALGVGSGLVLDQIVYLVATQATDKDYLSPLSIEGSLAFLFLATLTLFVIFWINRN